MWPWRRRSRRTAQRSTAGTPAPTTASPPPVRRPAPPAWQGLPPIQRTTADEPRLNVPEAFTSSLAAWRDPSYLAPLGHLVGDAEPAGVLHGAAVPVDKPAAPEPAQLGGDDRASLPLATPAAGTRRGAPSVQRRVAPAYGHLAAPDLPRRTEPVPVEPITVNRLLTAPQPPVELRLPTVDRPADPAQRAADTDPPEPDDSPAEATESPTGSAQQPAESTQRPVEASPPEPVRPVEAPTLGQDAPASAAPAGVTGPDVALPAPSPPVRPVAAGGERPAPSLPVQRSAAPRPLRRLGLGEPIVSPPLSPPAVPAPTTLHPAATREVSPTQHVPPAQHVPPIQRVPAGEAGPALVHRPPPAATEAVTAGDGADAGHRRAGGDTAQQNAEGSAPTPATAEGTTAAQDTTTTESATAPEGSTATGAGGHAGLVGEAVVARLTVDAADGPAVDPTSAGTDWPVFAQTFVRPDDAPVSTAARSAPLLAQPPAATPPTPGGGLAEAPGRGGRVTDSAGGPPAREPGRDLPVVSRLEASTAQPTMGTADGGTGSFGGTVPGRHADRLDAPHEPPHSERETDGFDAGSGTTGAEPAVAGLVGGYGEAPDAPSDDACAGQPIDAPAPPPLVVARLVGDRPVRLLTETPASTAPAPARPTVQRVTWQRAETPAPITPTAVPAPSTPTVAPVPDVRRPQPSPLGPPAAPAAHVAPEDVPAATEDVPVRRWIGVLPGAAGDPPVAYPGTGPKPATAAPDRDPTGPIVQRVEPADPPPPIDVPPPAEPPAPPTAASPPPGDAPTVPDPAAPGQAALGAPAGLEPEELLKKLYDPLLRRLKTELRLDRERHGVLGGPG